jgi:hypothetical protein
MPRNYSSVQSLNRGIRRSHVVGVQPFIVLRNVIDRNADSASAKDAFLVLAVVDLRQNDARSLSIHIYYAIVHSRQL